MTLQCIRIARASLVTQGVIFSQVVGPIRVALNYNRL